MSQYILLEGLEVRRFQMLQSPYLASPVPLFAACMFAHALAARMGSQDQGVVLITHDVQPDVESLPKLGDNGSTVFITHIVRSLRGACGYQVGKGDGGDYSSKNPYPQSRSGQPSITGSGDFSLLIRVNESIDAHAIERQMMGMRFAGGAIDKVDHVRVLDEAPYRLPFGRVAVDASDRVRKRVDAGMPIERAVFANAEQLQDEGGNDLPTPMLIPVALGHALLGPLKLREGTRRSPSSFGLAGESIPSAPCESLIGLVDMQRASKAWNQRRDLFWRLHWGLEDQAAPAFDYCLLKQGE